MGIRPIGRTVQVINPHKILHGGSDWIVPTDIVSVVEESEEDNEEGKEDEELEEDGEEDMTNLSECRERSKAEQSNFGCQSKHKVAIRNCKGQLGTTIYNLEKLRDEASLLFQQLDIQR